MTAGQVHDAGAILEYVPAVGVQSRSVIPGDAEGGPPRTQGQPDASCTSGFCRVPDAWMHDAACTDQRPIHIDPYQSNRRIVQSPAACRNVFEEGDIVA